MVMEFEKLRDDLQSAGFGEVAQDLDQVLQRHRDSLPLQLPQEELTLEESSSGVFITKQMVNNPDYLEFLLDELIGRTPNPIELTPGKFTTLPTITKYRLFRHANTGGFDENRKRLSLIELVTMSDEDLRGIRGFGPNCLRLFRSATQVVKERFIDQQLTLPPQ